MEKEKYEISSSLPLFSRTIQGASSLLLPLEIRASFYRADDPNSADSKRLTSQTLWLSFPDGGDEEDQVALPVIDLKSDLS